MVKKITDEKKEKKTERLNHIQVETDEGERLSIDYDTPAVGVSDLTNHSYTITGSRKFNAEHSTTH